MSPRNHHHHHNRETENDKSKKKGAVKKKGSKESIPVQLVDKERLFDTMFEYIRVQSCHRKGFVKEGYGLLVVDLMSDNEHMETEVSALLDRLEWWSEERCTRERLPEYLPTDPIHYQPDIQENIRSRCPPTNQMIIGHVPTASLLGVWNHCEHPAVVE